MIHRDIVRLRRPGDQLRLNDDHWAQVPESKRGAARGFGLAIDAAEKELAARFGAEISATYDPHDYRFVFYYDIKSTQGKWLSISVEELSFARAQEVLGRDVIYPVYLQGADFQAYSFLGYTTFKTLQAKKDVIIGSSPYWPMTVVRSAFI